MIGVPKTIDNDLYGTDHTPGFASAARFFIHGLRFIGADNRALPGVTVVEVLGRNAGWLVASTLLARQEPDDAPHLVYLPERRLPFPATGCRRRAGLSKVGTGGRGGLRRAAGREWRAIRSRYADHQQGAAGAESGPCLVDEAYAKSLGVNARSEKPGLLGRSFASAGIAGGSR